MGFDHVNEYSAVVSGVGWSEVLILRGGQRCRHDTIKPCNVWSDVEGGEVGLGVGIWT